MLPPRSIVFVVLVGCAFEPRGGEPVDSLTASDAANELDARVDGSLPACPPDYVIHGTGTYRHVTTVATWENARADCDDDDDSGAFARHTHLVVLSGELERTGLRATFDGPKLWLGVSDRVTTASWRWVTLEDTSGYPPGMGTPWKGGQPNDGSAGDEDCVIMEGNGLWDDRLCDNDTEEYVCECDSNEEVASQTDPQI